jgi:hypothetical protein
MTRNDDPSDRLSVSPLTLAQKLAILDDLGIRRASCCTIDYLRAKLGDPRPEHEFSDLFAVLTWERCVLAETGETVRCSTDVMVFDFECIDQPKAYSGILHKLNDLFRGSLGLTKINSHMDRDAKTAWATCEAGGKVYHLDLEWKEDWADSKIIDFVADIAKELSIERRLAYIDGGGQNITLFALTEAELGEMRRRTGLDVNWIWEIPAHIAAILRSYETERGNE